MQKTQAVLLPALLCNAGIFINQVHQLQPMADFLIPDMAMDDNIEGLAQKILQQAPETFALGGISMGGYVALEIMRQAPERVSSLLLMDTTAAPDAPEKRDMRLKLIEKAKINGIESVVPQVLMSLVAPEFRQLPQLQRFFEFMAQAIGAEAFEREQTTIMNRPDSRPFLPEISCKTIVVGGDKDDVTPPDVMKASADKIPGALHAVIANSGHLSPVENPSAVTAIMKIWLQNAGD